MIEFDLHCEPNHPQSEGSFFANVAHGPDFPDENSPHNESDFAGMGRVKPLG